MPRNARGIKILVYKVVTTTRGIFPALTTAIRPPRAWSHLLPTTTLCSRCCCLSVLEMRNWGLWRQKQPWKQLSRDLVLSLKDHFCILNIVFRYNILEFKDCTAAFPFAPNSAFYTELRPLRQMRDPELELPSVPSPLQAPWPLQKGRRQAGAAACYQRNCGPHGTGMSSRGDEQDLSLSNPKASFSVLQTQGFSDLLADQTEHYNSWLKSRQVGRRGKERYRA